MRPQLITNQKRLWKGNIALLGIIFFVVLLVNLSVGSVWIPLHVWWDFVIGNEVRASWEQILLNYRLPKSITAILAGMGLGISGMQMQTFFRNPLAGPFVLGVSAGASLGVALLVMAGLGLGFTNHAGLQVLAAAIGAGGVMLLVVATASRLRDNMSLLIVGLMFGSATGAIVGVLQFFSQAASIQAYLSWTFGSLGTVSWSEMQIFMPTILLGLVISVALLKPLNALLLGEQYARSLGIDLRKTKLAIIIATSLLSGTITAFCGPIAFIGVALPHLARIMYNTSDHRRLFPIILLMGGIVMLACDTIAQLPGSQHTLPINAVTAMLGAPVIIWIILRKKNIQKNFG